MSFTAVINLFPWKAQVLSAFKMEYIGILLGGSPVLPCKMLSIRHWPVGVSIHQMAPFLCLLFPPARNSKMETDPKCLEHGADDVGRRGGVQCELCGLYALLSSWDSFSIKKNMKKCISLHVAIQMTLLILYNKGFSSA